MADTVRKGLRSFLRITSASDTTITISEGVNHLTDCAKNRIWYWGKSKQLQELYESLDVQKTMFGGLFHKSTEYTDQMWCDGQYM